MPVAGSIRRCARTTGIWLGFRCGPTKSFLNPLTEVSATPEQKRERPIAESADLTLHGWAFHVCVWIGLQSATPASRQSSRHRAATPSMTSVRGSRRTAKLAPRVPAIYILVSAPWEPPDPTERDPPGASQVPIGDPNSAQWVFVGVAPTQFRNDGRPPETRRDNCSRSEKPEVGGSTPPLTTTKPPAVQGVLSCPLRPGEHEAPPRRRPGSVPGRSQDGRHRQEASSYVVKRPLNCRTTARCCR